MSTKGMKESCAMDHEQLYQAIFKRKSVRKYQPEALDEETMSSVKENLTALMPLFPDIRTELQVLDAGQAKGWRNAGTPHFLALYSEERGEYKANAGFLLQQMDLFLSSQGIGTCYQGLAKPTKSIGQVNDLSLVIMLAFGRPAEPIHRNSISEFERKPLSAISEAKGADDLLEPARLAPSALYHQRWFFTGDSRMINVYIYKGLLGESWNRIDAGIAMCHTWLAASHLGKKAEAIKDPDAESNAPSGRSYVASLKIS